MTDVVQAEHQRAQARSTLRQARLRPVLEPAVELPVARVAVDIPLAHLDRPFDYLVPVSMAAAAQPGVRVRVRFAGQLVGGFILERTQRSEHAGHLAFLHKVVSPEPVLSPQIAALARVVADRYAGTLPDVLRLAVPPRHARVEAAAHPAPARGAPTAGAVPLDVRDHQRWAPYDGGQELLSRLRAGEAPRAVWTATADPQWPDAIAAAVGATLAGGRGSLIVVADARDLARVATAVSAVVGGEHCVALSADLGPAERYRRFLAVRRGVVHVVVGTRAAMFAPVVRLGLAVLWDDGDDLHAEPHAPYPHVRKVLALRSTYEHAGLLLGGFTQTTEGAQLVADGWAEPRRAARQVVRDAAPLVQVAGSDSELVRDGAARSARLPTIAWRAAHEGLAAGPVLVQVPRHGYVPSLACQTCRSPARCVVCAGPLAASSSRSSTTCGWCGVDAGAWQCPHCGARRLRALAVGAGRTAEELGRAFPRTRVRTSDRGGVLATVGPEPALVVATPGAEPVAEGGYAAALLLDGWAMLTRPDLRAGEEALRRWINAAALVRPTGAGGVVVLSAEPTHPAVQALVRWDPVGFAERELAERAALRLPPAVLMASVTGDADAVHRVLELTTLPEPADVLGPVPARAAPHSDGLTAQRLLIRVPRHNGPQLVSALRAAAGIRSAHKEPGAARVQIDPQEIA